MTLALAVVMAALIAAAAATSEQQTVEVTLQQGVMQGLRENGSSGRHYYAFRSIPYAKPPIGPLRFKDPEKAPAWSGVRESKSPIPMCPQTVLVDQGKVTGQEDCLYLNVFTPKVNVSNLPVMVFIHGGGFVFGSAEDLPPAVLLQKDVVVVSINYRLGALGFLSTEDDVLPGNLGLKDQTLALRWVQDNIRYLGGDPQQVTIFGISAGGVSVHLHVLSPSSKGLFQRAIIQSGTALMSNMMPRSREGAIRISKALNCTGEESQQLLACFREADAEDLVTAPYTLMEWMYYPTTVGISVDGTFLPDHPAALHKAGSFNKVDVMAGVTQDDGNVLTATLMGKQGVKWLKDLNANLTKFAPLMLGLTTEENPGYLARRVFLNYMTDVNLTQADEFIMTRIVTDAYFNAPNMQVVEFLAKDKNTKTFMYQFDHRPKKSLMYVFLNETQTRAMAGHGDEMLFLSEMPQEMKDMQLTRQQDLHVRDILVDLWTNFASTGNPTINGSLGFRWIPVGPEEPLRYLSLTTTPTMQPVFHKNRNFWNSLPTKANKLLYPELFLQE